MTVLRMETAREARRARESRRKIGLTPVWDGEGAAGALVDLMEEVRAILDRLEAHRAKGEKARPIQAARRATLRFLASENDWIDLHDLPSQGSLGRVGNRSLARSLARDGLVETRQDPTYPNMTSLRITVEGREELRRANVKEAMAHIQGAEGEAHDAMKEARTAIRRLAALI